MKTTAQLQEEKRYEYARKVVKQRSEFYLHVAKFIVVGGAFLAFAYYTSYFPFKFALIGMGFWMVGVIIDGLKSFQLLPGKGAWEERKIREFMDKQDNDSTRWK